MKALVMKAEYYTLDWHTPPAGTGYTVQDVASKWCLADGELLLDGKRRRMELTGAGVIGAAAAFLSVLLGRVSTDLTTLQQLRNTRDASSLSSIGANGVVAAYETETHSVVPGDPRKTKFKLKKLPEGMMQGQRGVIKRFANLDKQGAMVRAMCMAWQVRRQASGCAWCMGAAQPPAQSTPNMSL
jgi:predicted TIM-barrel enzyme